MAGFLWVVSAACFLFSALLMVSAKGAIHEIFAGVMLLICAVCFCSAGVIDALKALLKAMKVSKETVALD